HRIAAARNVASNAAYGNVAVTQSHARKSFNLHLLQSRLLRLREAQNLGLSELYVPNSFRSNCGHESFDLIGRETEARRRPAVEFFRQLSDGRVATHLHIGNDLLDGLADLNVCGIAFCYF